MYVYGGVLSKDGSVSSDLFWISTDRMEWNKVPVTSGDKPPARQGHNCVGDPEGKRLIVFGGKSEVRVDRICLYLRTEKPL